MPFRRFEKAVAVATAATATAIFLAFLLML
jgi:hypothetical protein